jgi:AsmA-like C-terminal region
MSAILEPPQESFVVKPRRSHSWARRFFVTTLRFLVVVTLGAMAGGGWYLAKKGFGRKWRGLVVEELHKHGVEASVRRLTLDPFRGLVAQDVRIFDYKNRENTIAQISRISLDVNYAALLQHQPFLNAIDIRNAQVSLPLPEGADPNVPHAEIRSLHAHIYFPPEQIYVSQADGIFCGIRISATGQLIKRNEYQQSKETTEEEWLRRLSILQRVVSELNQFKFSERPHLQIKFSGDIADLENARVEGTLQSGPFQRGNYQARKLNLAGEFVDQTLSIRQCELQDDLGAFSANATWRRPVNEIQFRARSSLNLRPLLESVGLGSIVSDINFLAPPRFEISGTARFGEGQPHWQAIGHAALDRFTFKGILFLGANAEFSWDGERTMVRDIHVRHQSGELAGRLLDAPNDFRIDLSSTIDPNALRTLASAGMRDFVNDWDWPHVANVQLVIRGSSAAPATWKGDGTLKMERGRFRTVGFNSASTNVHFGDGAVAYENFRVIRDEGVVTGTFIYDFAHHETRMSNVVSNLRTTEAIFWVDPNLFKVVAPYKFQKPPTITTNGVYQFRGGKNTRLEINIDSAARMDYVFLGKTLPFDRIKAKLLLTNDRLQISELNGAIFSGTLQGNADISLAKNDQRYRATMTVDRVDFPRLTDLYFKYKTSTGSMNGRYDWAGDGSDARSMSGKGEVEVRNGDVFAIPLFGPLSDILNKLMPGIGYRVARKANMSFTIKDGVIRTPDFHVDAGVFGMVGQGNAHFLDDKIDFDVRIDASGAGIFLNPLYKFFEYKAEGSLKKPDWHPKIF